MILVNPSQRVTPDGERISNATLRTQLGDRVETTHEVGTVGKLGGRFVPAEFRKQQAERRTQATGTQSCARYDKNGNNDGEGQSEKILEQEQVLSLLERLPKIRESDPKFETKQNSRTRIERVGISHDVSNPRGAVVNACVDGTHVEVLLDTGATTDLIRTDVARKMFDAPTMERYVGRLETADGQIMAVDGVVRTRFKLGDIAEELKALVAPKLKAEMVLGLQSMKEYQCSLVFSRGEDFLRTRTREGSMVPIRHLTHRPSPERMPSLSHEPDGQIKGNHIPRSDMRKRLIAKITAAVESADKILEGWPTNYDNHSINVVQKTKVGEYEMYGCPKPVLLDEALRQTRGGSQKERVAVVQEVDEVVDSDAKRCRTHEEREGLGDGREVGPRDAKAAYFHNLIDRWKCVESFGEDEVDRGWVKSECEVHKQC